MATTEVYEKLRQKMNLYSINCPKNPKVIKALKNMFSPEEAEMLSNFNQPYYDAYTIEEFAKNLICKNKKFKKYLMV
jgi:hypothetical protein